jgi:hypothetical protein
MNIYQCDQCGAWIAANLPFEFQSAVHYKGEDAIMYNKSFDLEDERVCVGTLKYLG